MPDLPKTRYSWKTHRLQLSEAVLSVQWDAVGRELAALTASGEMELLDVNAESGRTIMAHPEGGLAMAWSLASGIVTSGSEGRLRFWSMEDASVCRLDIDTNGKWVEQLVWSPDGKMLLYAEGKKVRVVDAEGRVIYEWDKHPSVVTAVAWRPDGKGFATATYGGARLFRLEEPEPHQLLEWSGPLLSLAWSPSARFLASGSQEGTIRFWRLPYRPGEELQMTGYPAKLRELAWDSTGRFLASGGGENVTIWDVSGKGPANTTPVVFDEHPARISQLQFQADGNLLFSGDHSGEVAIWQMPHTDSLLHEVLDGGVTAAAWAPGSSPKIAVGTADGELALFSGEVA